MKRLLPFLFILLLFSCSKSEDIANISKLAGKFIPTEGIQVSGNAEIFISTNAQMVNLKDFSISDGPDLKVYLSKTNLPNDFISLGDLTSARTYAINQVVDFSQYRYVLIHCEEFNHLYAVAKLENQ
jgi:hypothetical protein